MYCSIICCSQLPLVLVAEDYLYMMLDVLKLLLTLCSMNLVWLLPSLLDLLKQNLR